jgi:hypothetical protein
MNLSKNGRYAIVLFTGLLLIYQFTAFNVTVSNDSCTNIEQITAGDIFRRSAHFGFNFLGVAFFKLLSIIGISSPVFSTQFMLAFFSAAGSVALYFIALKRFNQTSTALLTAVIYALSSNVWRFSLQSEYLVLVPSLTLIAIACWLYNKGVLAGILFALALLTSPFALFGLPLALAFPNKKPLKEIALTAAGFIVTYGFVSFFTFEETLQGEWSYNLVFTYYQKSILSIKPLRVAAIWAYGYLRSFHVLIPLLLWSLWRSFRSNRSWFFITVLGVLVHLPAAIPEIRYGAYQMTFYPILALHITGLYAESTSKTIKRLNLAVLLFVLVNSYIVFEERYFQHQLADTYEQIQSDKTIADSSTVLMYQATKPLNTIYAPRVKGVAIFSAYQEKLTENLERFELPDYASIGSQQQYVYLIESGTSMPDDRLKALVSSFVKNQGAKLKGFGREKVKTMYPNSTLEGLQGFSLPVYRIRIDKQP